MEQGYTLRKPESIKNRKRLGRGTASGSGSKCGKGQKGQKCRSGYKYRAWFEGGQMPLQRRIPKRGFNNIFKTDYQIVNLSALVKIGSDEIKPELMKKKGVIRSKDKLIKVLANGDITKSMKIHADSFSKKAIEKIKNAGGEAIVRTFPSEKQS